MANEKSRNHDTKGDNGGASKHQGKPKDQDGGGSKAADGKNASGDGAQGREGEGEAGRQ